MIYTMKKKKESGYLKRFKNLKVMKKLLNTGLGGKVTKIQEKKDSGIFWEAEADILRQELINRDVP